VADWKQAVEDGRRFLARWGEQAEAWDGRRPTCSGSRRAGQARPEYRRLSRYDDSGLIWLLRGRPVVALTDVARQSG
jgi:hypothetical protein